MTWKHDTSWMTPEHKTPNTIEAAFIQEFKRTTADAHAINDAHGFNDDDKLIDAFEIYLKGEPDVVRGTFTPLVKIMRNARIGLKIALVMSELGEALEAVRKGIDKDDHVPEFSGFAAEMADAVIRLQNLANDEGQPLAEAIVAKQNFNRNRPFKHGGKKF